MKSQKSLFVAIGATLLIAVTAAWAADVSITAGNVAPSSAAKKSTLIAGETITAGMPVYIDANNQLKKVAAKGSTATAANIAGIAVTGGASGQPVTFVTSDPALSPGFVATPGVVYVPAPSGTPGTIAPSADCSTGCYTGIVGVGLSSGKIYLKPYSGGVTQ